MTVLRGERVTLRPLTADDVERLAEILREPEVARWFGTASAEESAEEFALSEESAGFAIEVEGKVVGAIQAYEENEPDYRHAGMDLFVETASQGSGVGTEALRLLARHLLEERGHHRLVIDPAAANARAIKVYERIGVKPVGIMRAYERGIDGTWHDGLLMDLLAEELV
jgi:aminoglycoside 6'-N-acetyltransferase